MADWNMGVYRPRPRGNYNDTTEYTYLDIVRFEGASYININLDTIDGIACIGVAPAGQPQSESYWQCLGEKGDKGDVADSYLPYITVEDGAWDYTIADKIFIPETAEDSLRIDNVYNGCCGIIITKKDLVLPANSYYAVDYNYCSITTNDGYYFYTFTYSNFGSDSNMFIWHRTVIQRNV